MPWVDARGICVALAKAGGRDGTNVGMDTDCFEDTMLTVAGNGHVGVWFDVLCKG